MSLPNYVFMYYSLISGTSQNSCIMALKSYIIKFRARFIFPHYYPSSAVIPTLDLFPNDLRAKIKSAQYIFTGLLVITDLLHSKFYN